MDGIATDRFVAGADLPDARALREAAGLGGSGRDLIDAVLAADIARVRFLMERDPALAQTSSDGRSLAEVAVATGNAMLLREILSHGVDPDGAGDGAPLVLALHANGPELAYVLLAEHGAAPAPARGALEPVRAAIALGSAAGVRMLLDHGLDPNVRDTLDRRPLHVALDMERFAIAELLLVAGADPFAIDIGGANLAASLAMPMVTDVPDEAAARARLTDGLARLGWPSPAPTPREVLALAADGRWPPR
ncbi:hypothetical protein COA17_06010 [Sphingomonas ginsenosidimutans]|jgi:hypothetical protein|uniref:Uncharacterized protein n=1 Tax=Sphingomonas ginsenosidimutans TaxID=862134 RepID=A0A2A4HZM7_9SPHN|nr:ankyrin repeat domain-containing protein [Sphingomonas ginsenosidimutans]MEE2916955.1 ankyrin repeat domain-containing protein [Pseudomonadota bacterium]PCG09443.1 hypothetical protein COA17_06010 [Sphingomonas ginsenosidimutans]